MFDPFGIVWQCPECKCYDSNNHHLGCRFGRLQQIGSTLREKPEVVDNKDRRNETVVLLEESKIYMIDTPYGVSEEWFDTFSAAKARAEEIADSDDDEKLYRIFQAQVRFLKYVDEEPDQLGSVWRSR